jgi:hypothetical protein
MISREFSTPHALELTEEDPEQPKVFSEPQDEDSHAVAEKVSPNHQCSTERIPIG